MEKTIILVPGANPEAAKPIFTAIKESFRNTDYEILELEHADQEELVTKAKNIRHKILIGKSYGATIAIDFQLKYKNSEALVLMAPAVGASNRFKEINIPILLAHGTEDSVIPIENSRNLKKYFKNCKLVEISNTDHGFGGKEKETAEVIANWIFSL